MRGNRQGNSNRLDIDINGANRAVRRLVAILVLTWVVIGSALYLWGIPAWISEESCLGNLPVSCSEVRSLARGIVSSSIAVAIIFALNYRLIQRLNDSREEILKREIASQVVMELEQALANQAEVQKKLTQYGIADCCMSLDLIKEKALKLPCNDIRIMTTWFTNAGRLYQLFNNVAKQHPNNYRIRILLLNPNSGSAKQRSQDLKEVNEDTVPHNIRECRAAIESLKLNRVEIKYYSALPSFPLYIFGNHAFFGVFPHGIWADSGPWLEVLLQDSDNNHTEIGRFLINEFDKVWENAGAVKR